MKPISSAGSGLSTMQAILWGTLLCMGGLRDAEAAEPGPLGLPPAWTACHYPNWGNHDNS